MTKWDQTAFLIGFANEQEMFKTLYVERGMSISQIATQLKVGTCTVANRLERCGITKRPKGGANSQLPQSYKLFHLDQRVVLSLPPKQVAKITGTSYAFAYKFQKRRLPNGILYYFTYSGSTQVRSLVEDAPSPATNSEPTIL